MEFDHEYAASTRNRDRRADKPPTLLIEAVDARKGRIVELKFFGGLTTTETAEVMELSSATIEREWKFARAWLYRALRNGVA